MIFVRMPNDENILWFDEIQTWISGMLVISNIISVIYVYNIPSGNVT